MKMLLIATTALVCVTSFAAAGSRPERQAGSGQSGLNTNQEFLCTYGFKMFSYFDDYFGGWNLAATPVIGKGTEVNEIIVADGPSGGYAPNGFQVAIYSSQHGKPNKQLVSASAKQPGCGRVEVPISPITLELGKKYWIVQKVLDDSRVSNPSASMVWLYDKKLTHGAMWQSVSSSSSIVTPGPWKPLKKGVPYARVRETARASEPGNPPQPQGASDGSISSAETPTATPPRHGGHEGEIPRYPP
jgi:hypothetical protein